MRKGTGVSSNVIAMIFFVTFMVALIFFVFWAITSMDAQVSKELANKNPKVGRVYLTDSVNGDYKVCDGPNLLYSIGRGGSVVHNDPECAG